MDDGTAGDDYINSGVLMNDTSWHYVVAQRSNGSGTNDELELWVDGILTASKTSSEVASFSITDVIIGANGSGADKWHGLLGGMFWSLTPMTEREIKAEYQRGLRRINSTIDANDTISDDDVASVATDPAGKYVTVMGDDKAAYIFDEFGVPVASDTYPGTTARGSAIKSMLNGPDPHYVMAGSDQIEIVQPNTKIGV
jgi:hypothetical protein